VHSVVINKIDSGTITYIDPIDGEEHTMPLDEFMERYPINTNDNLLVPWFSSSDDNS